MADINQQKRQEIYDRIRNSSKDEYILSEMKRLGFWDESEDKPQLAENLIKERSGLNKELHSLLKEKMIFDNPEKLLQRIHKERMKRSKQQQLENKKKRLAEREQKKKEWAEKKLTDIIYVGKDYSALLNKTVSDFDALKLKGLPLLSTAKELADAMGLSISELRFLCYRRNVSEISHYRKFSVSKKSGGERIIYAPMPRLKNAQYWVLEHILNKCEIHKNAHGFVANHSILSNAEKHSNQSTVINIDMQDFFPSIKFNRVLGMYRSLGYSPAVSSLLALLCTQAETEEVELDGKSYYANLGNDFLPQGSPASPAITNIICWRIDKRLTGLAKASNAVYTRYADDVTFSLNEKDPKAAKCLLKSARKIAENEGFRINSKKTRVMNKNRRQEVTGVVVNDVCNSPDDRLQNSTNAK